MGVYVSKNTILVVDDTDISRLATTILLRTHGYEVDEASDGLKGFLKALRNDYSAIVMDYDLPVVGGRECTQFLRKIERREGRPRVPIIGFTANDLKDVRELCMIAGMDECLSKAATSNELLRAIEKVSSNAAMS